MIYDVRLLLHDLLCRDPFVHHLICQLYLIRKIVIRFYLIAVRPKAQRIYIMQYYIINIFLLICFYFIYVRNILVIYICSAFTLVIYIV